MGGIKKKKLDILKAYEDSLRDPHRYDKWRFIAPPLAIVLVVAVVCGVLFWNIYSINTSIKSANKNIATTKAAIAATDSNSYKELQTMQQAVNAMNSINKQISSYVPFSSTKLNRIVTLSDTYGVDIKGLEYTQSNAQLTVDGEVDDVDDIYPYVNAMRKSKLYKSVQYDGYTINTTDSSTLTTSSTMAYDNSDTTSVTVTTAEDDDDDDSTTTAKTTTGSSSSKSSSSSAKTGSTSTKSGSSIKKSTSSTTTAKTSTSSSSSGSNTSSSSANSGTSTTSGSSTSTTAGSSSTSSSASPSSSDSSGSTSSATTEKTVYTFSVVVTLK